MKEIESGRKIWCERRENQDGVLYYTKKYFPRFNYYKMTPPSSKGPPGHPFKFSKVHTSS